ncbi:MAG: TIGR03668 family PPOX class F420-dependent oxidoreductase [Alphaproteobacteria bacterium]|nr:TIGR03668 family PPOX class F420-dependent oxidoreductase [Alphaproteobacteria bacterium]
MLTDEQRKFLETERVARLATVDAAGQPHVVPICYALIGDVAYFTIDQKPKRRGELKRIANIKANPKTALVADRYDEDWSKLGWVMIQGEAEILESGDLHDRAQARLSERYPQLRAMRLAHLPVIAIEIAHVMSWGCLEAMPGRQENQSGQS